MKNDLYEKAKQAVAEKHGYKTFGDLTWQKCHNIDSLAAPFRDEVAELYGQLVANEAVGEDRKQLSERYGIQRMKELPLPFSELEKQNHQ